jgi:hypothetical protein
MDFESSSVDQAQCLDRGEARAPVMIWKGVTVRDTPVTPVAVIGRLSPA